MRCATACIIATMSADPSAVAGAPVVEIVFPPHVGGAIAALVLALLIVILALIPPPRPPKR